MVIVIIWLRLGARLRFQEQISKKKPWKIGVDYPLPNTNPGEKIMGIVPLVDKSMATSGNYRNFFEHDSKKYSHIIDPRTGYAIESNIASVTVIAKSCMEADAVATVLNIMSLESGKQMVENNDGIEAFWVVNEGEGFTTVKSSGMEISLLN